MVLRKKSIDAKHILALREILVIEKTFSKICLTLLNNKQEFLEIFRFKKECTSGYLYLVNDDCKTIKKSNYKELYLKNIFGIHF